MAEYDLGTARGRIELDASGFKAGAAEARDANQSLKNNLEQNRAAVRRTGAALVGVGAAAVAGFGAAVSAAAGFEAEISNFQAAAQVSEEALERVRAKAIQIGQDTSFGAAEAASAITNLSYAGLDVEEILAGAADSAVALAEAGELEIPQAASIMTAAMNSFGIAAEDTGEIADTLIGVFANSDTMVDQLGEALQQVSATASTAGISLEDTTVALGLLADKGIKGGKAGTTLNRMLINLLGASGPAKEAMRELGLITEDGANKFFDAEGNMKSLAEVSDILAGSLEGMTKEQKLASLETVFGSRALSAASALAEAGAEGFNDLAGAMGEVAAADVAAGKLDNLSGAVKILKGTIETALISAGSPFQDMLKGIVQSVTTVINKFSELDPNIQKIIVIVGLAIGALAGLVGVGLLLAPAIAAASGAMAIFTGTILPIVGIVLGVIAAIGLIGFAIYKLWTTNEQFRAGVTAIWEGIKQAFQNAIAVIKTIVGVFKGDVGAMSDAIGMFGSDGFALLRKVQTVWRQIRQAVAAAAEFLTQKLTEFVEWAKQWWATWGEDIMSTARQAWDGIIGVISSAIDAISAVISAVLNAVQALWRTWGETILAVGRRIFDILANVVENVWNGIKNIISGVLNVVQGIFETFAGLFTGDWSRMWEGVKQIAVGLWQTIVGLWQGIVNSVVDILHGLVASAGRIIGDLISRITGPLVTFAGDMVQMGKDIVQGLIDGIVDMAGNAVDAVVDTVRNIKDAALNFLGISSPSKEFKKIGQQTIEGLTVGIKDGGTDAANAVKRIAADLISKAKELPKALVDVAKASDKWVRILGDRLDGVRSRLDAARDSVKRYQQLHTQMIEGIKDSFSGSVFGKAEQRETSLSKTLAQQLKTAQQFRKKITKIADLGASDELLNRLLAAGPDAMGDLDELLAGGATAIKKISSLQSQVIEASRGLGEQAADRMYAAGLNAAHGLVKGLEQQESHIKQRMEDMAGWLVDTIKKELGIKSPSRVMMEQAQYAVEGFRKGLESMKKPVVQVAAQIADATVSAVTPVQRLTPVAALASPPRAGGAHGASQGQRGASPFDREGPLVHQEVHNASNADITRATERGLRKVATEWGFD